MYVAGTHPTLLHDWIEDIALPLHLTHMTQRYKQADQRLSSAARVKRLVGHSLGGSVVLQLEKDYPGRFTTTTYGALVVSLSGGDRYRHYLDPFSAFDRGAHTYTPRSFNPHSFGWLGDRTEVSSGEEPQDHPAPANPPPDKKPEWQ